ncbi:30755_t:CDS:2, partial [Racocetra persica]
FPHIKDGQVTRGKIIEKLCSVRFIKIIPLDISSCSFVALICIGTHNHPPPPPEKIPANVKNTLQTLIKQAINNNEALTAHSFITGNFIKASFNTEIFSQIHASLNNVDRLRYLVNKANKEIYPYGQSIMGIWYNITQKLNNLHKYVQKI